VSGFAGGDPASIAATWVGAAVTIGVWSYFVGGGRIFRLAQYLLAGLATGYLVLLAVREVLVPQLFSPLADDPAQPLLWVALVLVLVVVGVRWLPASIVALPVALLVAGTAAFALAGTVVGTVLPQLAAAVMPPTETPIGLLNGLISMLIAILVIAGFLHGTRPGRLSGSAAAAGRWLLLGGIGGWLGFLVVSRLAVLVDRLHFLLADWLGLIQ
jgi:hypothetical protein